MSSDAVHTTDVDRGLLIDALSAEFFREDPSRVGALAHPMRIKIIRLAQGRELSAKQASELLEEPIGKVSYHFRVLAEAGLLELVRQTPRRGAIESHYRALVSVEVDDETWVKGGPELWRPLVTAFVQSWAADMVHAADAGEFEFDGALFGNAHFEADEEGLGDLRQAFAEHYDRLLEIEASIRARCEDEPEAETVPVNVGFAVHGGERHASRNHPFVVQHSPPPLRLIPEDFPEVDD